MPLFKSIEDQIVFHFTGKINLLVKGSGQYIGSVFLKEGFIVNSYFGKFSGPEAIFCLFIYDKENIDDCKYIVEPEIVDQFRSVFKLSLSEVKKQSSEFYKNYQNAYTRCPSMSLSIRVSPGFVLKGARLDTYEYSVLQSVCDNTLIKDIYTDLEIPNYLITLCLVSLREKQALKVCQST